MGGGVMIRAAATKLVGRGIINGGLRSAKTENPFAIAVRSGARPMSTVVSSSEEEERVESPVQRTYRGIDDWELAGGEEEELFGSGESTARLVFGGVPTLEETEEATSELRDVLNKAYLSPEPQIFDSKNLETTASVWSDSTVNYPVPKHAIQAFKFLNDTPGAQSVVASIACDAKVWDAVLQNEAVMGFLQSHQTGTSQGPFTDKSLASNAESETPEVFGESKSVSWVTDYLENVRVSVAEMMSNLSDYFQNIFSSADDDDKASSSSSFIGDNKTVGASLMGLAIMVIMVVVFKRG